MKLHLKKIALVVVICITYSTALCQRMTVAEFYKNKVKVGGVLLDTVKATPGQMASFRRSETAKTLAKDHFYFDRPYFGSYKRIGVRFTPGLSSKKTEVYEGNDWGTVTGKQYKSILIDGDAGVEFSALDVTEANAGDFRYHVVQNEKRELVSWTKPSVFKKSTDGKVTYAYLGKFVYIPGQVLKVEIYNIHDYGNLDASIIDWRKVQKPQIFGVIGYFSKKWDRTDGSLSGKLLTDTQRNTEQYFDRFKGVLYRPAKVKDFIETTDPKDIKFRADDSLKNITFRITNANINHRYKVQLDKVADDSNETVRLPETNGIVDVNRALWKTPGKYKITFTPRLQKHGGRPVYLLDSLATSISFTVLPPEKKDIPLKTVVAIILTLMTATAIMFTLFRSKHTRKLAKEAQNRQIAALQLQSVRSQLNPHFIFNALAGIQNLMNKNAIEDANKYLTRFARLTRNVLDDGQKDLISIEKETSLLDDYLQMEQTRFGFNYTLNVDEPIDQQIEMPAMLLQPFVENAVKHGISALKEKGQVDVSITQSNKDLLLKVQDNGGGFKGESADGKGIKLCRERIALFNSIHKNTLILLHINPSDSGSIVTIELKNWL